MAHKPLSSLTIFFPAYYDENTVEPLTRASIETARRLSDDFEIIIVDDKSPDRTGEAADRMALEHKEVRVVHHPENRGVGQAMISGYAHAAKDWIFYTDGDMQYDVQELDGLAAHAADFDVIVGYRLKRADGLLRLLLSRSFHLLISLFFRGVHYRDIDCSFKLLNRRFLDKAVFYTGNALIDAELLIEANRLKLPVKEIPVHHYPRKFGSSRCLRLGLILSMLLDIVRLRLKLM